MRESWPLSLKSKPKYILSNVVEQSSHLQREDHNRQEELQHQHAGTQCILQSI